MSGAVDGDDPDVARQNRKRFSATTIFADLGRHPEVIGLCLVGGGDAAADTPTCRVVQESVAPSPIKLSGQRSVYGRRKGSAELLNV